MAMMISRRITFDPGTARRAHRQAFGRIGRIYTCGSGLRAARLGAL